MLEQIIRDIKDKGWSFRENILTAHDMSAIALFFESHRSEFTPAMVGKGQSRQRNENIRGDHTFASTDAVRDRGAADEDS